MVFVRVVYERRGEASRARAWEGNESIARASRRDARESSRARRGSSKSAQGGKWANGDKGFPGKGPHPGKGPVRDDRRGRTGPAPDFVIIEGEPGGKHVPLMKPGVDGLLHRSGTWDLGEDRKDRMFWLHQRMVETLRQHLDDDKNLRSKFVNWTCVRGSAFWLTRASPASRARRIPSLGRSSSARTIRATAPCSSRR